MFQLANEVSAETLLDLQPEELAAQILFILRRRNESRRQPESFSLPNILGKLWPTNYVGGNEPPYPPEHKEEINLAIAEAWGMVSCSVLACADRIARVQ